MASGKEAYGEKRKIKNNKGVFLPQKPQNITHLHLLIRLYDLFLLRSGFLLRTMCKVSMPHFTRSWAPNKLFIEVGNNGNIFYQSEEPKITDMSHPRESFWGAKLKFTFSKSNKTQVSKQSVVRGFESLLFHYPITQESMVDT